MRTVRIGTVDVTRMVMGGNPFSGFSHQGPAYLDTVIFQQIPENGTRTTWKPSARPFRLPSQRKSAPL